MYLWLFQSGRELSGHVQKALESELGLVIFELIDFLSFNYIGNDLKTTSENIVSIREV